MNVHATIDGRPVDLKDWACDSTVNWGHRSLTGRIDEEVTWAEQEAPIRLWLPDGTELWSGRLSLDPETDRGMRSIRAEGYAQDILASSETPLLYRHDGGGGWSEPEGDPHNYATTDAGYNVDARPSRLAFFHENGHAYALNDRNGLLFWAEGSEITRYSYVLNKSSSVSAFDFLIRQALGPSGSFTTPADGDATTALSGAGPASGTRVTVDLDAGADLVAHFINCNSATTPAVRRRFWASGLRVYGRTIDDSFSAGEVVTDVGATAGLDTSGVQANALAILPLFWTDDHPDLLDYIAELCDWQWQVISNADGEPALAFGPYETTWTAYQDSGVRPNWEAQKRFNAVEVPFETVSGRHRSVTVMAEDDPFPGQSVVYTTEPLEDPQQDSTLATAAATAQTAYWASKRVSGRIELGRVYDEPGASSDGGHVRPGHLIDVAERPDLGPQRIVAMNYRASGPPIAEINDDFNVLRLLAQVQDDVKPGRRKKRKRRHRK